MNKAFHITTFGCQMNEHDSEIMAGMLEEIGYERKERRQDAEVLIINTCSVRENADKRFFGTLGQLKHRHEDDPDLVVCVCGCMMQQKHVVDTINEKYPWVDIVFGTNNMHRLPHLLNDLLQSREGGEEKNEREIWEQAKEIVEGLPSERLYKCKALVNIMYGCNNFCTYCIVPYTRGRERSREPEEILKEICALAADGVKEVMLLGQNVNSYKGVWHCGGQCTFAELITSIAEIDGIERIRFMTSHPKDISDELIALFRTCPKLCRNIHLPVQAGSNEILKRMNRRYTREVYLEEIRKLREAAPDITISTDIIVGFPGETEEDFQKTLDLVNEVRYDSAFTFLYSKRRGTPAEKYGNQIPDDVMHERFGRLVDAIDTISAEKNSAYEGRIEEVLVEGPSKRDSKTYAGRTDGFKLVNFSADKDLTGKFVKVRITKGKTFSLEGELVMETERLILRRWKDSDAEDLFEYASDPDVGPNAGWPPHKTIQESRDVIRTVFSGPEAYAICDIDTDRAIGSIELKSGDRTELAESSTECELGFCLNKKYWGQGLMPEAVAEMLRHAFEDLGVTKVWCGYYDWNDRSKRVQEKSGFRYQRKAEHYMIPLLQKECTSHISSITREQWLTDREDKDGRE